MFVKAFERSGFRGPINWYRNFDRNWEETADLEYNGLSAGADDLRGAATRSCRRGWPPE